MRSCQRAGQGVHGDGGPRSAPRTTTPARTAISIICRRLSSRERLRYGTGRVNPGWNLIAQPSKEPSVFQTGDAVYPQNYTMCEYSGTARALAPRRCP